MANHGTAFATRFKLMRERIRANPAEIWTQSTAAFDSEFRRNRPMMQWPNPFKSLTRPSLSGAHSPMQQKRAIAYGDGWIPIGGRALGSARVLPQFRQMAKDAGRDPRVALLQRLRRAPRPGGAAKALPRDAGVDRVVLMLPPKPRDAILPILDEGAALVTAL